jgi:hypothetical protein
LALAVGLSIVPHGGGRVARLDGRQWGLVAIVAGSPLLVALLLGSLQPLVLRPVMSTLVGGLSWVLACLLGWVGGLFFARGLVRLRGSMAFATSSLRRALGLVLAALPPIALCIVPALMLLLAGPAYATVASQRESMSEQTGTTIRSAAVGFMGAMKRSLPSRLPLLPRAL